MFKYILFILAIVVSTGAQAGNGNGYRGYGYSYGGSFGGCWRCGGPMFELLYTPPMYAPYIIYQAPVYVMPQPVIVAPPPVVIVPSYRQNGCREFQTGWTMDGRPITSITCQ